MDEGSYFAGDDSPLVLDPFTITVTSDTTLGPGDAIRKRTLECSTEKVRMRQYRQELEFTGFKCQHATDSI